MAQQSNATYSETVWRLFRIVIYGGLAIFVSFCILDFIEVRFGQSAISNHAWLLFDSFPVLVCLCGIVLLRGISVWLRCPLAIAGALLASVLGLALVATAGFWFHAMVGGPL